MAIGVKLHELSRAMGRLAADNILTHDGASVTILDSIALRRASCECYKVLKALAEKPLIAENRLLARRATPEKGKLARNNVVPIRNLTVCTLCGLGNNCPHKTFDECLRAVGSELRATSARAKWLLERRARIVHQSLAKYQRFLKRRHS